MVYYFKWILLAFGILAKWSFHLFYYLIYETVNIGDMVWWLSTRFIIYKRTRTISKWAFCAISFSFRYTHWHKTFKNISFPQCDPINSARYDKPYIYYCQLGWYGDTHKWFLSLLYICYISQFMEVRVRGTKEIISE